MALLNAQRAALACRICGSPDRACGGHPDRAPSSVLDLEPGRPALRAPASVYARAVVRGSVTIFRTTEAEATARGWEILGPLSGPPPTLEPAEPAEPEPAKKPAPKTKPRRPAKAKPRTPDPGEVA